MLISIVMSCRNAAPFLHQCLASILAQTDTRWELIAVDDYSTDDTWAILQAYAKTENRIRTFQNTDRGLIPALRNAYDRSSGDLLTRMDADDLMPPDRLHRMRQCWQKVGCGNVVTGVVRYFRTSSPLGKGYRYYEQWLNGLSRQANNFSEIYRECVIPSPCWLLHRNDFEACGAFRNDTYPEDYDLCFRMYRQGLKVAAVQEVMHWWRDHAMRSTRTDERYAVRTYFDLKLSYFLEIDYDAERPLLLWGAGNKGKALATCLLTHNVVFSWHTNNIRKQGKHIYGVSLLAQSEIDRFERAQILVALSAPAEREEARIFLASLTSASEMQVFYFC